MRRATLLRTLTLALAFVHTLPARKHLASFFADPSWSEGWKGIGAAVAVALYLLPPSVQSRGLQIVWQRKASALRLLGFALAAVHLVPALDHVPRFLAAGSPGDAWRGIGAAVAVVWFLAPLRVQAHWLGTLARFARLPHRGPAALDSI